MAQGLAGAELLEEDVTRALSAFNAMAPVEGMVKERPVPDLAVAERPDWTTLGAEDVSLSGPAIHAGSTSVEVRTGLWRILRPVIDYGRCNRCSWVCGSLCPDSAISVADDGRPVIDYDHCKGCMICVAVCPPHAIDTIPEARAKEHET